MVRLSLVVFLSLANTFLFSLHGATDGSELSIKSERATYTYTTTPSSSLVCVHEGNVEVVLKNTLDAKADKLVAYLNGAGDKKGTSSMSNVERIELHGHVLVTNPQHTLAAERAILTDERTRCTMEGGVIFTRKDARGTAITMRAPSAVLDLVSNSVTLEGGSRSPVHTVVLMPVPQRSQGASSKK